MGDPKKSRKKYDTPKKMWDKSKLEERKALTETYGLKNKKEVWKAETALRKKRQNARKLLALPSEKRKKRERELLDSLLALGVLNKNASLDDVLSLKAEALLERRLESIVWRQGICSTPKQARQLITHGHIGIGGKKVSSPSYLVGKGEEHKVGFLDKGMELKVKKGMEKKERRERKPSAPRALGAIHEAPKKARAPAEKPAEGKKEGGEKPVGKKPEKPAEGKPSGKKPVKPAKPEAKEAPKEEKKPAKGEKKAEAKPKEKPAEKKAEEKPAKGEKPGAKKAKEKEAGKEEKPKGKEEKPAEGESK